MNRSHINQPQTSSFEYGRESAANADVTTLGRKKGPISGQEIEPLCWSREQREGFPVGVILNREQAAWLQRTHELVNMRLHLRKEAENPTSINEVIRVRRKRGVEQVGTPDLQPRRLAHGRVGEVPYGPTLGPVLPLRLAMPGER